MEELPHNDAVNTHPIPCARKGDQLEDAQLLLIRSQIKGIYPNMTEVDADRLIQRGGVAVQAYIDGLNLQLQQLTAELGGWVDQAAQDMAGKPAPLLAQGDEAAAGMSHAQIALHNERVQTNALDEEKANRTALAAALLAIWQQRAPLQDRLYSGEQLRGVRLDIAFKDLYRLPTLSARFDDVVELSMQGIRLTEQDGLNNFIESFPNLEVLNLENVDLRHFSDDDHEGCSLPPAICQLKHLTSLNLRATQLEFSERAASQVTDLLRLQSLDLSDNPLGVPPVVWGLNNLRRLNLRNTGISRCPAGIIDKPYLTLLDLRDNQITTIPQAVLNQAIAWDRVLLGNNPVTDQDTLQRLITHRDKTGINLWSSAPGPGYASPAAWLSGTEAGLREACLHLWQQMALIPGGGRFLDLVNLLTLTPDFQVNYLDLQTRVWRLLKGVNASNERLEQLIRHVPRPQDGLDNPFARFTALESRVQLYRDWVASRESIPIQR